MEKNLEIKLVKLNDSSFDIEIYAPESGDFTRKTFDYSPDEHSEFDGTFGYEIYSWITMLMEQEEA